MLYHVTCIIIILYMSDALVQVISLALVNAVTPVR